MKTVKEREMMKDLTADSSLKQRLGPAAPQILLNNQMSSVSVEGLKDAESEMR